MDELDRLEEEELQRDFAQVRDEFAEHLRALRAELGRPGLGGLSEAERIPVLQEFARWFLREMLTTDDDED